MFQRINAGVTSFLQLWWKRNRQNRPLSPTAARSIQKRSCQPVDVVSDNALTPPYVLIAGELSYPQQPVFEAAAYYLCTIAAFEPKYKSAIVSILKAYLQDHRDQTARIQYLKQLIKKYNL